MPTDPAAIQALVHTLIASLVFVPAGVLAGRLK